MSASVLLDLQLGLWTNRWRVASQYSMWTPPVLLWNPSVDSRLRAHPK